jgi:enoyl-CoA hydratase
LFSHRGRQASATGHSHGDFGCGVARPGVRVTTCGTVAEVTIGDGSRHNALGSHAWAALEHAFHDLAGDAEMRAVVLTGGGPSFCAGFDIREWEGATPGEVDTAFAQMEAACAAIEDLPIPVVAKVRGVAAGAGCQLALACDLRVAGRHARLGMPIARLGILASPAFAARLSLPAGPGAARDLLYTGRLMGAAEAAQFGLVTRCVPDARLDKATAALVESIVSQPPAAISAAKRAVATALRPTIEAARQAVGGPAVDYGNFRRGVDAFLHGSHPAHRPPVAE